ncbi:zinc finger, C3HC4 type [Dictyocaulus viviparus]|uniref:Zinc finger, C3HC4 type n=1 Tax=Dictyocaulus viviparus TaxID=29172 RepID=A0A0D8XFJ5_DICVI|nr:zinc finger, C3HC4 type [Dictyocaulus viviparus]
MGQFISRYFGMFITQVANRRTNNDEDPEQLTFTNSTAFQAYSKFVFLIGVTGSFFGSHFLMCGGRFDMAKPEAFLFGENSDLDLLGCRSVPFPYASPLGSDEVRPLHLLVNVRKESVKLVRIRGSDGTENDSTLYRLEFTLDADCSCFVQIHFNARELYQDGEIQIAYRNKRVSCSDLYHFDSGSDQIFNNFIFDSSKWKIADLTYSEGLYFPIVIIIQTDGFDRVQMQSTMCTVDVATDSSHAFILKPLRQKIACDGVVYLLQEIFGIENKEVCTDGSDECGLECIICMSDIRDTVILPCRHLCICNNCADTLRYKLNNCPICRSPFRALIQLRARRQTRNLGYETITLVEGLNGPLPHQSYGDIEKNSESPLNSVRRGHLQDISCGRNTISENINMDSDDGEMEETSEGIEMKRYFSKDVILQGENPVLSGNSSRSSGSYFNTTLKENKVLFPMDNVEPVTENSGLQACGSHLS